MSNLFSAYGKFDKEITKKYGHQYVRYPHAMMLFDLILRHAETTKKTFCISAINRLKDKSGSKGNLKTGLRRFFYFTGSILAALLLNKKCILVDLPSRFNCLVGSLREICAEYDIKIVNMALVRGFKFSGYKDKFYIDPFIFSRGVKKVIKNLSYDNLHDVIGNNELIEKINAEIGRNIERLARFMKRKQLKLILASSDQPYIQQVISTAAEKASVPYYVIFHGYPQGGRYIGLLPIHAQKLFVWADENKNRLIEALKSSSKPGDARKVEVFGYPIYDRKFVEKSKEKYAENPRKITFISQPFEAAGIDLDRNLLYQKLLELKNKGFIIQVRLHRKEKSNKTNLELIKKYNLDLSGNSLIQDLLESKIILGYNSSVIYEAMLLNKNIFQIKGLNIDYLYEDVPKISIDEIPGIGNLILPEQLTYKNAILIADFKEKLQSLLHEAKVI